MGDIKHVSDVFLYRYVLFVIQNQLGQGYTLQTSKNFKLLPVVTATMAVETPLYDNNMLNFQKLLSNAFKVLKIIVGAN